MSYEWSKEEESLLVELIPKQTSAYLNLLPLFPGRTLSSLYAKAYKMKLSSPYFHKKYSFFENYFHDLSYLNCFFAGWIAADGCIWEKESKYIKNHHSFRWQLHSIDENALHLFKSELQSNAKITKVKNKRITKRGTQEIHSVFLLSNIGKMAHDLKNNFSIIPNKTLILSPPNILSTEFKLAYLIGYINGDGSIFITDSGLKNENKKISINIVSSSQKIIEWCVALINSLNLPSIKNRGKTRARTIPNKNAWDMNISGLKAIYLLELLKRVPVPVLDRKWNNPKVLEFIEKKKIEHPEWFTLSIDDLILKLGLNFSEPEVPPVLIPQISEITL
jgi:hypothetical protein